MDAIQIMFMDKRSIDAVDNLIDESLLETDHNGNYWLHPLVQEFSYDDLEDKKGAHKLAMEYYLSLHRPQKPTKKEAVRQLIEAHYHACTAEEFDQAFDIIFDNNLHNYLDLWGNYTLLIDLYSKLLPENHSGNEILPEDKGSHRVILNNLGIVYENLGDPRKAIEYYEKSLKIAQDIGDKRNEENWLVNLGDACSDLGDPRKAIECYNQALEINPEDPNVWYNKACNESLMNKKSEALIHLKHAVELDPEYKELVKSDKDFHNLWDEREFKDIITSNKKK